MGTGAGSGGAEMGSVRWDTPGLRRVADYPGLAAAVPSAGRPINPPPPRVPPRPAVPPRPSYPPPPPQPGGQPELPPEAGSRLRPTLAVLCLVLGFGLLVGAALGGWLTGRSASADEAADRASERYELARELWHNVPVDSLFPRTLHDTNGGPGGAARTWSRVGVAPESGCVKAFDPLLAQVLAKAGCASLLRATYTDTTSSTVTTVGVLVTKAAPDTMRALSKRWEEEGLSDRTDMLPYPVAFPGTPAEKFGARQRGSWLVKIGEDVPWVVYGVSGFADGRTVTEPLPAAKAVKVGATAAPAQAGLGNDAQGIASLIRMSLVAAVDDAWRERHPTSTGPGGE